MTPTAVDDSTPIAAQERTVTPSTANAAYAVSPIVFVNAISAPPVGVNAILESPAVVVNTVSVPYTALVHNSLVVNVDEETKAEETLCFILAKKIELSCFIAWTPIQFC